MPLVAAELGGHWGLCSCFCGLGLEHCRLVSHDLARSGFAPCARDDGGHVTEEADRRSPALGAGPYFSGSSHFSDVFTPASWPTAVLPGSGELPQARAPSSWAVPTELWFSGGDMTDMSRDCCRWWAEVRAPGVVGCRARSESPPGPQVCRTRVWAGAAALSCPMCCAGRQEAGSSQHHLQPGSPQPWQPSCVQEPKLGRW